MPDLRNTILDVVRDNEQAVVPFLIRGAKRTHAFLGSCGRMKEQPIFSQHPEDSRQPCILNQVYARLYPHVVQAVPPIEKHPFFELSRLDCAFFTSTRKPDKAGYPVEWELDWLIEVENNLLEFTMHLRGLLDFIANHRLGIFFCDRPDDQIGRLTNEFLVSWRPFAAKYSFANDLDLQAIFFPENYTTFREYSDASRTFIWNGKEESFQRL